jgi:hypothetical protein
MPGGSAREGACIAAGVAAVGACVLRNENGVRGGAECVMARGRSEWGDVQRLGGRPRLRGG